MLVQRKGVWLRATNLIAAGIAFSRQRLTVKRLVDELLRGWHHCGDSPWICSPKHLAIVRVLIVFWDSVAVWGGEHYRVGAAH